MKQVSSCIGALACIVGALCFVPPSASAGAVTANATIDLATAITGNTWTGYGLPLDAPVTVNDGDSVTIQIRFVGNQQLTWDGNGFFNPWLMLTGFPNGSIPSAQEGFFGWSNLAVSFQASSPVTPFDSGSLIDGESGIIHLGPTYVLDGAGVERSFTGVTVSFTTTFTDGATTRDYSTIGYFDGIFAGAVNWSEVAGAEGVAVHEPGGLALLGTALMAFGMLRRRQGEA